MKDAMKFEEFPDTDEQGRYVSSKMKQIRVSEDSRRLARNLPVEIPSLEVLREERQRLTLQLKELDAQINAFDEVMTDEQRRIRQEYAGEKGRSIEMWITRRQELRKERRGLIKQKVQLEQQLADLKCRMQNLHQKSSSLKEELRGIIHEEVLPLLQEQTRLMQEVLALVRGTMAVVAEVDKRVT